MLKQQPVLDVRVDPDLLGGMVVQVGDRVIDTSVRTRLQTLRTLLLDKGSSYVVENQGRRDHQRPDHRRSSDFDRKVETREVGQVLEVGDGIARCYGLSDVMAGELVDFPDAGVKGLAFNLEEISVAVIILGDYLKVTRGDGGPHDRRAAVACRSARR